MSAAVLPRAGYGPGQWRTHPLSGPVCATTGRSVLEVAGTFFLPLVGELQCQCFSFLSFLAGRDDAVVSASL